MSDKATEPEVGREIPGEIHIVSRRKVVRPIELHSEHVDFGQPTEEKDIVELQKLAEEEADDFIRNSLNTERLINEATLRNIASHINKKFMFHNSHDVGIGTIPKQIENYRTSSKEELPDK